MPLVLKFDSAEFAEKDAEEIWREGLDAMFEIQRPTNPPAPFRASQESWALGGMLLTSHITHGEAVYQRTKRKIATSGVDHYLVHCLLDGRMVSTFGRDTHEVSLGSVVVRDLAVENIGVTRDAPMLTLMIPRQAIDRRTGGLLQMHGLSWEATDPIGRLVASHMRSLANVATSMDDEESSVAGEATLDFLAACVLRRAERREESGDPRLTPVIRAQARSYIEGNLADPGLGPARLREALKVSRTALYALFEPMGGVAEYIRARRLDEAMRRLESPAHSRDLIGAIACAAGFMSESTFNRAFKERFGCTPTDARARRVANGVTSLRTAANAGSMRNARSIGAETAARVRALHA
ncbi:AraC family transcriptional regulator [Caballeronia sordidicola]|uniref:AraC family transcriptional regulator n=1 Tax=Caballeronia sordidicola TaxID=196367 RepID=A0A158I7M2_CABSO|nr:helix-turn-helix domain-containing protein [Caballeronia sordidicola]SAL52558.1 AraC family transcriptional regulator [Caballeronia sordidicola]